MEGMALSYMRDPGFLLVGKLWHSFSSGQPLTLRRFHHQIRTPAPIRLLPDRQRFATPPAVPNGIAPWEMSKRKLKRGSARYQQAVPALGAGDQKTGCCRCFERNAAKSGPFGVVQNRKIFLIGVLVSQTALVPAMFGAQGEELRT